MALLTRCPACATWFKVVPDQLRVSQGWVKCGHCNDIFDARESLCELDLDAPQQPVAALEPSDDASALAQRVPGAVLEQAKGGTDEGDSLARSARPGAPAVPDIAGPATPAALTPTASSDAPLAYALLSDAPARAAEPSLEPSDALLMHITPTLEPRFAQPNLAPVPDVHAAGTPQSAPRSEPVWDVPPAAAQPLSDPLGPVDSAPADLASVAPASGAPTPVDPAPAQTVVNETPTVGDTPDSPVARQAIESPAAHEPTAAEVPSTWEPLARAQALPLPDAAVFAFQRPPSVWRRRALGALIALAALALAAQVAWFNRSRWAADPAWRDSLQALGMPWGVRIDDWADPQALQLEGVSLQRQSDGTLLLRAGLHNASPRWLALPALELSLTDTQDAVLIRAVWTAAQWTQAQQEAQTQQGAAPLPPQGQREVKLRLHLSGAQDSPFVGYRLLAFYP